ncbi:MAG: glycoside hydrolase family 32 protein [Flavobacteriaceae bacterium]
MNGKKTSFFLLLLTIASTSCKNNEQNQEPIAATKTDTAYYKEAFRPQFHFSPERMWMNDPNGLVYNQGIYHMFYQYYPEDIVWGPMHWGHATSTDLIHWEHQPIALYPDEHGLIFSGSAVLDAMNSSGFGTLENPPLVAIFTYHDMEAEKAGKADYETQGIAYSLDNGKSWTKYKANPVIQNPGLKDFRDPKVIWHRESQSWVLTLVAGDHAEFYSSKNLIDWQKQGEFGKGIGAHGGVWECPDLLSFKVEGNGETKWVLLISINPGAPNGGSGTQYFVGNFDGNTFAAEQKGEGWIDWGTDNYAGVTFSNRPNESPIFIGWMSNWAYATATPTENWRSAMTLPRTLSLKKVGDRYKLFNYPVEGLDTIIESGEPKGIAVEGNQMESLALNGGNQSEIKFNTLSTDFVLHLKNGAGERLTLTMDGARKLFLIDRKSAGRIDFKESFAEKIQQMPIANLPVEGYEVRLLLDWSSLEVFINKGEYVMTVQLFPNKPFDRFEVENVRMEALVLKDFEMGRVKSIW